MEEVLLLSHNSLFSFLLLFLDVIGYSTIPEVIVAVHSGIRVLCFAMVTDMCLPGQETVPVNTILQTALTTAPKVAEIMKVLLKECSI